MTQKVTRATSRAYRKLYGPAVKSFSRVISSFVNKNSKQLVTKFYQLYKPTIEKSLERIEKASSVDEEWIEFVTQDLNGDIALDPIVALFTDEAAEVILRTLAEEHVLFDRGIVTEAWMRDHGLDLASSVAESLKDPLRNILAEGIFLNESPSLLKERLRGILVDADEYQLNRLARTESMKAVNQGALESYRASPTFNAIQWIAHAGACVICQGLDGVIVTIGKLFPGGYEVPPDAHPNCRCTIGGVRQLKKMMKSMLRKFLRKAA